MNLSFTSPALLWGLVAAALPLVVHLFFRRRPRPTPFPAIDFILRARQENQRRLRLKRILLFVARTALLAAVALAVARPRLVAPEAKAAQGAVGPAAVAIVLDASASMGYRRFAGTLFDRAKADAIEVLTGLNSDEPATLVVCGGPSVPQAERPSFDKAELRRRIAAAELTHGHADLTSCVGAAVQALAESAAGQALRRKLFVATDMTAVSWRLDAAPPVVATPSGPVRPEVTLLDAARGERLENAWLSSVAAEPDPSVGPRGYRITATVNGQRREPEKDASLSLRVGDGKQERMAIRSFIEVPQAGSTKKTLAYDFPTGGPAVLSLSLPEDAYPEDDALALTLHVPREVKVLVVDGAPSPVRQRDAAFFVEAALSGNSSPVRPTVVDQDGLSKVRLSDYDVVFLLNVRSLGEKAPELVDFVERGGGLFLAMGDEVDPDRYELELKRILPAPLHVVKTADRSAARFAEVDWDHPALAVFSGPAREGLESVRTFRYMLLKPERKDASSRVLVRFEDGSPALVEARRGQGRVMLFTSTVDREWSDWSIRTSFLPAMQRIAAFLAGGLEERRDWPTPVFAPRILPAPEGIQVVSLLGPDGRERRVEATSGAASVTPDVPGLWQVKVRREGKEALDPTLAFAVWPDPRESDMRRLEPSELTAWFGGESHARVAGDRPAREGRDIPLWSWLLVVAVAAFLAEGLLVA